MRTAQLVSALCWWRVAESGNLCRASITGLSSNKSHRFLSNNRHKLQLAPSWCRQEEAAAWSYPPTFRYCTAFSPISG